MPNDNFGKEIILRIYVDNSIYNYAQAVYFVTNSEGVLIASKKVENSTTNILYKDESIELEAYNLHKFVFYNDSTYYLESLFDINLSYFTDNQCCNAQNMFPYIGNCSFNFTDIPQCDWYSMHFPSGGQANLPGSRSTDLFTGNNFLFTFIKKSNNYYYKYYYDFTPGQTYSISLDTNLMESDVVIKYINAPENLKFKDSYIRRYLNGDYMCYAADHGIYTEEQDDSTRLNIVCPPDNNEPFKYYYSKLGFVNTNDSKQYLYSYLGDIPSNIPQFNFDIEIQNYHMDELDILLFGEYDFLYGEYSMGQGYSNLNKWKFYTNNSENVEFPVLPGEVLRLMPDLTSGSFIERENSFYKFSVYNVNEIIDYNDFINKYLNCRQTDKYQEYQMISIREYYFD